MNNWVIVRNDDYLGLRTHSRYIVNVYTLFRDNPPLVFNINRTSNYPSVTNLQRIINKLDIVKYTLGSIKTEEQFSQQDSDFMPLSLSWLWIKGYYAVFHLMSLLISLEKSDSRYMLSRGYNEHYKILDLSNQIITSSNPFNIRELNTFFNGNTLDLYRSTGSINIRNVSTFDVNLFELSLRKVYVDELGKLKGMTRIQRASQVTRLNSNVYTVFNLFHNYRERFNYSGFHYLECDTDPYSQVELKKFYDASYIIIKSVSMAIINYLCRYTDGGLNTKLIDIQNNQ